MSDLCKVDVSIIRIYYIIRLTSQVFHIMTHDDGGGKLIGVFSQLHAEDGCALLHERHHWTVSRTIASSNIDFNLAARPSVRSVGPSEVHTR